jgi:8-amino-7-oxononanoate synthase
MTGTDFLEEKLRKRQQEGSLRKLSLSNGLIDFSSNDYIGFARSEQLLRRINAAASVLNTHGSTGSRLLSGNSALAEETECYIADFHAAEAALIFNSGYNANVGLFSCIAGKDATILYDEYIHASIKDGARLSHANHFSFRHNDVAHLEQKLNAAQGKVFVALESVYSMNGDLAPLAEIASLLQKHSDAHLIVDEAHATGVIGKKGQGLVQHLGLEEACFARIHTFGKALGCHGAVVLGSNTLREYLINFSRPFIYTTALPAPDMAAIRLAYEQLAEQPEPLSKLQDLISFLANKLNDLNIPGFSGQSAISIIPVTGNEKARAAAKVLQDNGFDVRPILSPTVPKGKECLRICLHTYNTEGEITELLNTLKTVL